MNGVFDDFVNSKCFVDRVEVNVWGTPRRATGSCIAPLPSIGIASPQSKYARLGKGTCSVTGNPVQWKYGNFQKPPWDLAPYRFLLRSESAPLTCAQLETAIDNVLRTRSRQVVSLVELTFDTSLGMQAVYRDLFTRSSRVYQVGSCWCVGSPRSAWRLRIYQKTWRVTRIEFVFRPKALRELHIRRPHDILRLRIADISRLVQWQEFDPIRTSVVIGQKASGPAVHLCLALQHRSMRHLDQLLRREYRVPTRPLLRPSPVQQLLQQMQSRFIW
jgi:hypothetical protein